MKMVGEKQDDAMQLLWDASAQCWSGLAIEPWRPVAAAAGPAGPAGIVQISAGALEISQCVLSGRVERLSVPAVLDPAQRALLGLFVIDPPNLDVNDSAPADRHVQIRIPSERLAVTRWARLDQAVSRFADDEVIRPYLFVEHAVQCLRLSASVPAWMTEKRVGQAFHDAAESFRWGDDSLNPAGDVDVGSTLANRLVRWADSMLGAGGAAVVRRRWERGARDRDLVGFLDGQLGEPPEGPDGSGHIGEGRLLDGATAIAGLHLGELLGQLEPGTSLDIDLVSRALQALKEEMAAFDQLPGLTKGVYRSADAEQPPIRGAWPLEQELSRSKSEALDQLRKPGLKLVTSPADLPVGPTASLEIADGKVLVDEITARRFHLRHGEGTVTQVGGGPWIEVVLPALWDSSIMTSRWVVLVNADEVIGVGPLVCRGDGDGRVASGWVVATDPDGLRVSSNPLVPDGLDTPVSLPRLTSVALRAMDRQLVGLDDLAADDWQQTAAEWLRLGSLVRAAWALEASGRDLPAGLFTDPVKQASAQQALDAIIAAGAVPHPGTETEQVEDIAWILIAEAAR